MLGKEKIILKKIIMNLEEKNYSMLVVNLTLKVFIFKNCLSGWWIMSLVSSKKWDRGWG